MKHLQETLFLSFSKNRLRFTSFEGTRDFAHSALQIEEGFAESDCPQGTKACVSILSRQSLYSKIGNTLLSQKGRPAEESRSPDSDL